MPRIKHFLKMFDSGLDKSLFVQFLHMVFDDVFQSISSLTTIDFSITVGINGVKVVLADGVTKDPFLDSSANSFSSFLEINGEAAIGITSASNDTDSSLNMNYAANFMLLLLRLNAWKLPLSEKRKSLMLLISARLIKASMTSMVVNWPSLSASIALKSSSLTS